MTFAGSFNYVNTGGWNNMKSFTLSPHNSVWILNGYYYPTAVVSNIAFLNYGFYTHNGANGANGAVPCGTGTVSFQSGSAYLYQFATSTGFPISCTCVVPSSSTTLYFNIIAGTNTTLNYVITATRIA